MIHPTGLHQNAYDRSSLLRYTIFPLFAFTIRLQMENDDLCLGETAQQSVNKMALASWSAWRDRKKNCAKFNADEGISHWGNTHTHIDGAHRTGVYRTSRRRNNCSHHVVKVNLINDKQRMQRRAMTANSQQPRTSDEQQNDWTTRRKWNKKAI